MNNYVSFSILSVSSTIAHVKWQVLGYHQKMVGTEKNKVRIETSSPGPTASESVGRRKTYAECWGLQAPQTAELL